MCGDAGFLVFGDDVGVGVSGGNKCDKHDGAPHLSVQRLVSVESGTAPRPLSLPQQQASGCQVPDTGDGVHALLPVADICRRPEAAAVHISILSCWHTILYKGVQGDAAVRRTKVFHPIRMGGVRADMPRCPCISAHKSIIPLPQSGIMKFQICSKPIFYLYIKIFMYKNFYV